jgi:hypothetical protein
VAKRSVLYEVAAMRKMGNEKKNSLSPDAADFLRPGSPCAARHHRASGVFAAGQQRTQMARQFPADRPGETRPRRACQAVFWRIYLD